MLQLKVQPMEPIAVVESIPVDSTTLEDSLAILQAEVSLLFRTLVLLKTSTLRTVYSLILASKLLAAAAQEHAQIGYQSARRFADQTKQRVEDARYHFTLFSYRATEVAKAIHSEAQETATEFVDLCKATVEAGRKTRAAVNNAALQLQNGYMAFKTYAQAKMTEDIATLNRIEEWWFGR